MASSTVPGRKHRFRGDRHLFSASDDTTMLNQLRATHAPDGRDIDVKPLLHIIEDIFYRAAPTVPGSTQGDQAQMDALDNKAFQAGYGELIELLAFTINKISNEIICKCSGSGDAHATTLSIFNMVSNYSWDAKVALALAAFAAYYGDFWLIAQLYTVNSLAKSVAILKQLPEIMEHPDSLKPKFEAIGNLIRAMVNVTKCIVEFKELPPQYITADTPVYESADALIPTAAYWIIRSILACASQIAGLIRMSNEYISSTTEAWELSSLAHKVSSIYDHLRKQLDLCYQHIDEKKHIEAYQLLIRTLETPHLDNMKILRLMIYSKDDQLPLWDGSANKRVSIDVLRRRNVLLLISDLDFSREELSMLIQMYQESRQHPAIGVYTGPNRTGPDRNRVGPGPVWTGWGGPAVDLILPVRVRSGPGPLPVRVLQGILYKGNRSGPELDLNRTGSGPDWTGLGGPELDLNFPVRSNPVQTGPDPVQIPVRFFFVHPYPARVESQYEVVWLPVIDKSAPWNDQKQSQFEALQLEMPWYTLYHPSLIDSAVLRYIKEVWHFSKKPMLVVLDPQGRVTNPNALYMMWIWGSLAFPFTRTREEALWGEEKWRLDLLADAIEPMIFQWMEDQKCICLYGGEDLDWIQKFTAKLHATAQAADIPLEMLYVGKSNLKEKIRKINDAITAQGLSHVLPEITLVWYFWVRLESMWHSKMQQGKTVQDDPIMQEIVTMMSFDAGDQGWALISRGATEMTKAKGETIMMCLEKFDEWEEDVPVKGFVQAIIDYLQKNQTPHHCNRLILPGTTGTVPDKVVCAECGRAMEKFIMYRCCTD